MPLTAIGGSQEPRVSGAALMMAGGTSFSLRRDREKAVRPHTTVGVSIGKETALQVRRLW